MLPDKKMRVAILFCAACLLTFAPASTPADEVHLKNGDRISGTVLKKENSVVTVRTDYAGTITINWNEISAIQTDKPVEVYLKDKSLAETRQIRSQPPATEPAGKEETIDIDKVWYISPPPYLTGKGVLWSGRMTTGYWHRDGNSSSGQFRIDGSVAARTKSSRYTVSGGYAMATDSGEETESRSSGLLKYDRFLSEKWYATAKISFTKDRFKDLNLRTILGAGPGYQFWESKRANLSIESGLDYVIEDYITAPDKEYPAVRWALLYDQYFFKDRLQAFHTQQLNISLEDTEDILVDTQTGVRVPLFLNLDASLEVDYEWDNQPSEGSKRGDTTYKFGLGYSW